MQFPRIFHFHMNREQGLTYESIALHFFALAMVSIYIPVFLYQETGSILPVFWYFLIETFFHLILLLLTPKWIAKMGLKHSTLFSKPFLIIAIFMFYTLNTFHWPMWVIAFFSAVYATFFWVAYHADLAQIGAQNQLGEEVSIAWTARILSTVIGPIIGAVLIAFIGFNALFALTLLFLVISVLPLFFSTEIYEPVKFSYENMFRDGKLAFGLAIAGLGIKEMAEKMWYLLVFLVIPDYTAYGLVNTASLALTVFGTILMGRLIDHYDHYFLARLGALANAAIYIAKGFLLSATSIFFISIPDGFVNAVVWIPMTAIGYEKTKNGNFMEWIVVREIMLLLGNAGVLVALILLFPFFGQNVLAFGMILAALGSLLMMLIR